MSKISSTTLPSLVTKHLSNLVGDFAVDNFYLLDKSSKRKDLLLQFCEFVEIEYRNILDHISVRWLSLEKVVAVYCCSILLSRVCTFLRNSHSPHSKD